jgi:hypothetical protein
MVCLLNYMRFNKIKEIRLFAKLLAEQWLKTMAVREPEMAECDGPYEMRGSNGSVSALV